MNLLVAAMERHPVFVVLVALVAVSLVAYGLDLFIGLAERDGRSPRR